MLLGGEYLLQKLGDGFGQLARIVGTHHGERQASGETVPRYSVGMEKSVLAPERMLGQYGVAET